MNALRSVPRRTIDWTLQHPRLGGLIATVLVVSVLWVVFRQTGEAGGVTVEVRRGELTSRIVTTGVLKPFQSITYRSPLAGRETEITFLVAEGTHVNEGDILVRLNAVPLERELERAKQDQRQAEVELQVAEIERQEAQSAIDSLSEGEAALTREEARTRLTLAERRVQRLKEELETLTPLMEKGFITREELRKTSDELERAEEDLALARRRTDILVERTYPQDRRKAQLQLAQREAQRANARTRLLELQAQIVQLTEAIENASVYARGPGLVVYEEYLGASPRRKIRAGDRVGESQGLVTIPEVSRMVVETSVSEADVQRVHAGQAAEISLEAFRGRQLKGTVARVGTVARTSSERPFEDKRFELIVDVESADGDLRPEMTAKVEVLVGERSGVLLAPINAIFERNGVPVAHVIRALGVETRPLTLGEVGDVDVEVLSGLLEGDRLALQDVAGDAPAMTKPSATTPSLQTTPGAFQREGSAGPSPR